MPKSEQAGFGAGCFWHVEHAFRQEKGVINVTSGYEGGHTKDPSYEDVCTGETGHAETVQVEFDPEVLSYEKLLAIFWSIHDPTIASFTPLMARKASSTPQKHPAAKMAFPISTSEDSSLF